MKITESRNLIRLSISGVALACLGAVIFGIDVSAQRDIAGDTFYRDANRHLPVHERFYDLSPLYIWVPSDLHVWDSVRSLTLPFWDRLQGGGYSPVLNLQNGVFHPARWATALVPRRAAPSVLVILILWISLSGMFELLVWMDRSIVAALGGAILFSFGSGLISTVHYSGGALPLAHLPWILLFLMRATEAPRRLWLAGLVVAVALLMIAGHPLIIFAALFSIGLFASVFLLTTGRKQMLSIFAVACLLALFCASFALLPGVLASLGDGWSYKTETSWGKSFRPHDLVVWVELFGKVLHEPTTGLECCVDTPRFWPFLGMPLVLLWIVGISHIRKEWRAMAISSVALFLLALPGPWMEPVRWLPLLNYLKDWYWVGCFWFFMVLVAATGFDAMRRSRAIAVGFAALLLAIAQHGYRAFTVLDPLRFSQLETGEIAQAAERLPPGARLTGLRGQTHAPNLARVSGVEDVRFVAPVLPLRTHLWWLAVDPEGGALSFPTTRITNRLESPLVRMFNVAALLQSRYPALDSLHTSVRQDRIDEQLMPLGGVEPFPLAVSRSARLFPVRGVLYPRAHFARSVVSVTSSERAWEILSELDKDVWVVESRESLPLDRESEGRAEVRYQGNNRVSIHTTSRRGTGLLVLAESYSPGWKATLDGERVEILPVNLNSRGVVVPEGEHIVEMSYVPPFFWHALALSTLTVLLMISSLESLVSNLAGWRDGSEAHAD